MRLSELISRKRSGIGNVCAVCGKGLKAGEIYRYKGSEKCCESCYLKANPPRKEEKITERLHRQWLDDVEKMERLSEDEKERKRRWAIEKRKILDNDTEQTKEETTLKRYLGTRSDEALQQLMHSNPRLMAMWKAAPPPPFPYFSKPRTKKELISQSQAFYREVHTDEERNKFEAYRETMLRILDEPLWKYQQEQKTKQNAEMEKALREKEKQRRQNEIRLEKERIKKNEENKREWLEHLEPFVRKHAKSDDCAAQIYNYIRDIIQMNEYPCWGEQTIITEDIIECKNSWSAHSFFDSGAGDTEESRFILFAGIHEEEKISNDRLSNPEPYDRRGYTHSIHDLFYCEDPLGLSGKFGFRFDFEHVYEEPDY